MLKPIMNLKIGDVVKLKSGGPAMTVELISRWDGIEKARCQWFSGDKVEQNVFTEEMLEKLPAQAKVARG